MLYELLQVIADSGRYPPAFALETLLTTSDVIRFSNCLQINDNRERLIGIAGSGICLAEPHPHVSIGAEYGRYSPFCVREGVLNKLKQAATYLNIEQPGCSLYIYDAYRPLSVQRFMVAHEFAKLAAERGIDSGTADKSVCESLMQEVLMVWAIPDTNPNCPPPHSTGAAVDVTIIDGQGDLLNMGSGIDALGKVSLPHYFLDTDSAQEVAYHANRELLQRVMLKAGFRRLPHEWWHFSYGDQLWALLQWLDDPGKRIKAIYGRIED